jgi:hypothetical protein
LPIESEILPAAQKENFKKLFFFPDKKVSKNWHVSNCFCCSDPKGNPSSLFLPLGKNEGRWNEGETSFQKKIPETTVAFKAARVGATLVLPFGKKGPPEEFLGFFPCTREKNGPLL